MRIRRGVNRVPRSRSHRHRQGTQIMTAPCGPLTRGSRPRIDQGDLPWSRRLLSSTRQSPQQRRHRFARGRAEGTADHRHRASVDLTPRRRCRSSPHAVPNRPNSSLICDNSRISEESCMLPGTVAGIHPQNDGDFPSRAGRFGEPIGRCRREEDLPAHVPVPGRQLGTATEDGGGEP
jgi:hypothetical protein